VIVSTGTANTPKLLELSGIGNPEILRRHGIRSQHELPGVGENLRDHFAATMKWTFNRPASRWPRRAGDGACGWRSCAGCSCARA
jgi:choline dehydrogenase